MFTESEKEEVLSEGSPAAGGYPLGGSGADAGGGRSTRFGAGA